MAAHQLRPEILRQENTAGEFSIILNVKVKVEVAPVSGPQWPFGLQLTQAPPVISGIFRQDIYEIYINEHYC